MNLKLYFSLFLFSCLSFGQSNYCELSTLICATSNVTFANITGIPSVPDGINYACLASYPNKQWFSLKIGNSGNLNYQISQINSSGIPADVDYILWGPFNSPSCGASNLTPSNTVSCSYSNSAVENFSITNAVANKYYVLMVANFSMAPGNITIAQTNFGQPNSGTPTCDLVCSVNLGPDVETCVNNPIILTASIAGGTYQWSSSVSGILPFTTQHITVNPSVTTTYTVVVNKPGCVAGATDSSTITVTNIDSQTPTNLTQCSTTASAVFNLSSTIPTILQNLNPINYNVKFHTNLVDALNIMSPITNPTAYTVYNNMTIYFSVENLNTGCSTTGSFQAIVNTTETPVVTPQINGQTITVNVTGSGNYQYQLDNGTFQNSNVFQNVEPGNHTITVNSTNGCGTSVVTININFVTAPTSTSPQYFNTGNTVQNLIANGQNILWYAASTNKNGTSANTNFTTFSTPLSSTTPLVNGTTYYASQTLNGVESQNRTPVLALLTTLSNENFAFSGFTYYPNPVKNTLTLSNSNTISSIEISSVLGQKIAYKKINELITEIDLSAFSKGVYFLKIVSNNYEKSIKIIKE